jgi:peptide/nickel transport system substrate-binding protein
MSRPAPARTAPRVHALRRALALLAACTATAAAAQTTLRIGLQDDPDMLDPHRARTYVGRIVFAGLCDKLIDLSPDMKLVPRLATSWAVSGDGKTVTLKLRDNVTFHDGEPFNAEAVKFNLDRARTLPDSLRKSEIAAIQSVDVVDRLTGAVRLKQPDAPLLSQLTDRAGMMLSPKAAAGANFAAAPVCSGPYRFVQRVQQDRIVLERFAGHWNAAAYHFDRIIYLPIPDTTVRLANLRSGNLDLVERLAPTDVKATAADPKLQVQRAPGLGYMGLNINVGNGERAKNPLGSDRRVRQALDLAIDREAINQVVFEGLFTPGNQPYPPTSSYFAKDTPLPARDVARAKALLKEAGITGPLKIEYQMANNPVAQQVAQLVQAMVAEAGFEVTLRATEYATLLKEQQQGNFQLSQTAWSGRPDPDGNVHQFVTCRGSQNDGKYCNPELDRLLDEARTTNDEAKRRALYAAAQKILWADLPLVYLYFEPRIFAMGKKLQGFVPHPDGMVRLDNLRF